jgi:thiamine biosynthesis lipoprotein
MDRRAFLSPRHFAKAAGPLLTAADEQFSPVPLTQEVPFLRAARRAMATRFEVVVPYGTPDARSIAESAFDEIDRLEQQLTVFRDGSEVSRLNRLAPHVAVTVEPNLFRLLQSAEQMTAETEGAFDITAGALVKAWGFYRGPRRVPSDAERLEALRRVGMQHVVLDAENRTVRYLKSGLEINLGSIGKGYALDRAAACLRSEWNVSAALLHGGQSSVYAVGSEPGTRRGWMIGIGHPWDAERRLATVRLRDRALGTSAATFRHVEYQGRKLGHILDPCTGWPAEGIASATVIAPTAAEADALATAFFILGVGRSAAYCEAHPEIAAILLPEGESAAPVVLGRPTEIELQ